MGWFGDNAWLVWVKLGLDLGKCWSVAKGGLPLCFIKTPYAKATMLDFLIGWSVGLSVGVVWTKGGDGFGEEAGVDFG
jgi:hypothetical protein